MNPIGQFFLVRHRVCSANQMSHHKTDINPGFLLPIFSGGGGGRGESIFTLIFIVMIIFLLFSGKILR